ncbi:hypothetical protein TNCV_28321 [Trichonephila clavipes]|uniref:Uncharacterized protein n=1 Tax=Trichonephila clavipes TaxID=2585209 RepID=A0A8X6WK54_TRICX|nr:hypothetical protein TNCV_28321 [Trichonephila clavipes]
MDLAILNHGQATRTTPERACPSSNFHATPTGRCLSLDIFNVHRPPLHGGSSAARSRISLHAGHEPVTFNTRLPRPLVASKSDINKQLINQPHKTLSSSRLNVPKLYYSMFFEGTMC